MTLPPSPLGLQVTDYQGMDHYPPSSSAASRSYTNQLHEMLRFIFQEWITVCERIKRGVYNLLICTQSSIWPSVHKHDINLRYCKAVISHDPGIPRQIYPFFCGMLLYATHGQVCPHSKERAPCQEKSH